MEKAKTWIKYLLCNMEWSKTILNIYFAFRRRGVRALKKIIQEEMDNFHYRRPWYVNRKELRVQKKEDFQNSVLFLLEIVPNTNRKDWNQTVESIKKQSYTGWEIYEGNVGKIKGKDENGKEIRVYYGRIQAGDILHPSCLWCVAECIVSDEPDLVYTDSNQFENWVKKANAPAYKPDFSPDTLRSYNYIGDFYFVSQEAKNIFSDMMGGKPEECGYQYLLMAAEKDMRVAHISKILYYKKVIDDSLLQRKMEQEKFALQQHLERTIGEDAFHVEMLSDGIHKISYRRKERPLISIIIPNMDHVGDLKRCVDSVIEKTSYENYEIIIVENNSKTEEIFTYYQELETIPNVRVLYWKKEFNYSALNNFAVDKANGEQIVLLNNDVEIISEHWLEEMLMYACRQDVGAVGALLFYPDDTVQHGGVILGIGGVAGHAHKHVRRDDTGYQNRLYTVQNLSAVTAACMMTRREIFLQVGGLDEEFQVAFNDIDYCMKLNEQGKKVIFTPYAQLYHYESISRGYETTPEKERRFRREVTRFMDKWGKQLQAGDPYYNPHLSLRYEDFRLK